MRTFTHSFFRADVSPSSERLLIKAGVYNTVPQKTTAHTLRESGLPLKSVRIGHGVQLCPSEFRTEVSNVMCGCQGLREGTGRAQRTLGAAQVLYVFCGLVCMAWPMCPYTAVTDTQPHMVTAVHHQQDFLSALVFYKPKIKSILKVAFDVGLIRSLGRAGVSPTSIVPKD